MFKLSTFGVTAATALVTFALAGCVAFGPGPSSTRTPAPSPAPSSPETPVGDGVAPDADLSFAAGADLPAGLSVTVGTAFAGDPAWEVVPYQWGAAFRHIATGCTVSYAVVDYPADSADDAESTLAAMSETLQDEELSKSPSMSSAFPYDPSGVLSLTGGEPSREIEFLSFASETDDHVYFASGRVIGAADQFIYIEVSCATTEVTRSIIQDAHGSFTIGLPPADLYAF